jgi:hypothetical protein
MKILVKQGPYSQQLMLFVTYEQTQQATVIVPAKPFQLSVV